MSLTALILPGALAATGLGFGAVAIYIDKPGPGQHPAPRGAGRSNWAAAAAPAAAAARRAWKRAAARLAMARDGEPRCDQCLCTKDALCGHSCCGGFLAAPRYEQPAGPSPFASLPHGARTGLWQPRPVPPADRPWLPATPRNAGPPDVDDLDDTGTMAALVDWAKAAPLREVRHG